MSQLIKFRKINEAHIAKNYPILLESVKIIEGLTLEQREKIYGLSIELILQSNGDISIIEDEPIEFNDDEEF